MSGFSDEIRAKLDTLPTSPGCYLFKEKSGKVVYVGKATSLRARVRSYFQPGTSDYRYFIPLLERVLADIDTIVTANEKEAVLLENALVKEHKPRYNVKLRDDKNYLSIRLDSKRPWPRLEVVRRPTMDGAEYYGPYPSATSARRTMRLCNKYFKLRTCDDHEFASRTRPCLEHQIKRCSAPCVLPVPPEEYFQQVRFVGLFLAGKNDELKKRLETDMKAAATEMEYERAGALRDQLWAVDKVLERQRVAEVSDMDRDVVGLYREGDIVAITVIVVRDGFVRDTQSTIVSKAEAPDDELLAAYISQRYGVGDPEPLKLARIPDEVIVPVRPEAADGLEDWLSDQHGRRVYIVQPLRGARTKLLAMATENAQHAFRERRVRESSARDHTMALQEKLGLEHPPRKIECIDISHHQGSETVGAIVCLVDGMPSKKHYRSFHVRTESSGDDYKAMLEVLRRRFRRGLTDDAAWRMPDLFVVDGGRGQLGVAMTVLQDLGIPDLPVCALAKERENPLGDKIVDRVYLPNRKNPISVDRNATALVLLARARDEAHRFANKIREGLLKRKRLRSALDSLPGVGTKTRVALLRAFGSVQAVRDATVEQLAQVPGIGDAKAKALRAALTDAAAAAPPVTRA